MSKAVRANTEVARQLQSKAREQAVRHVLTVIEARHRRRLRQRRLALASQAPAAPAPTPTPVAAPPEPQGSPQQIAMSMLGSYGWDSSQFACLDLLWTRESGWNPTATNPYSGAYGIPQALPASKMASAGADWQTNPATQITWGLGYIQATYGTPCSAWATEESQGSY